MKLVERVLFAAAAVVYVVGVGLATDCGDSNNIEYLVAIAVAGLLFAGGVMFSTLGQRRREGRSFERADWITLPILSLGTAALASGAVFVIAIGVGLHCLRW